MPTRNVQFLFLTGINRAVFHKARLCGSWDERGHWSDSWSTTSMTDSIVEDGCPQFSATVSFELAGRHQQFRWGVVASSLSN